MKTLKLPEVDGRFRIDYQNEIITKKEYDKLSSSMKEKLNGLRYRNIDGVYVEEKTYQMFYKSREKVKRRIIESSQDVIDKFSQAFRSNNNEDIWTQIDKLITCELSQFKNDINAIHELYVRGELQEVLGIGDKYKSKNIVQKLINSDDNYDMLRSSNGYIYIINVGLSTKKRINVNELPAKEAQRYINHYYEPWLVEEFKNYDDILNIWTTSIAQDIRQNGLLNDDNSWRLPISKDELVYLGINEEWINDQYQHEIIDKNYRNRGKRPPLIDQINSASSPPLGSGANKRDSRVTKTTDATLQER